jgi:hypothetical protein
MSIFLNEFEIDYTAGINIAEINTVFRGGEYRNFLINSKFVYGNSLLANRNTFLNESNTKNCFCIYIFKLQRLLKCYIRKSRNIFSVSAKFKKHMYIHL